MIITIIGICKNAQGQAIWTNPITGTNPNTSNPYTTGQTVDASITVSGIGRGTGITGVNTNDRYNASNWSTGAIDLNDYFEFTLTPNSTCEIDFTSFVYTAQVSSGTPSHALRSNLDGYTANIGTPNTTGTTISLAGAAYQNITTAITFRFYTFGIAASGTTFSINSFTFNGTTSCGCTVAPTISTNPSITNQTICSGSSLPTFTVTATGGGTITYEWFSNTSNSNTLGTTTGVTTNTYTPSNTLVGTTYYYCVATNACGSTASNVSGAVIVNALPANPGGTITPAANPACTSTTLSYSAPSATTYWQTASNGVLTTQTTQTDYTVSVSGTYYVRAFDGTCWSGSGVSSGAITINTPITITTQPSGANRGVCLGQTVPTLTVNATGSGVTYLWYSNTTNSTSGGTSLGITTNTMTPSTASPGTLYYYCIVSGASPCASVTSNLSGLFTVTNAAPPADAPSPTGITPACDFTSLDIMVPVAGSTYYWHGITNNGTTATTPTSSTFTVGISGTYYVRARDNITNCWSNNSSSLAVIINKSATITSHPVDKVICAAGTTTFTAAGIGTGITYQWYEDTDGAGPASPTALTNVAPYSGTTTATLTITSAPVGMNGYTYYCAVDATNPCTPVNTNSAILSVVAGGEPTTSALAVTASDIGCNGMNISWTKGDGSARLVVIRSGSAPVSPTDGVSYTANQNFGSGTNIGGTGSFVVYSGTGNSVFVYGLSASTTYYYSVFEYNGCGNDYKTSAIPGNNSTTGSCSSTLGITALYVDACAGSCNFEGNNELIWLTSGSYVIPVKDNAPALHYNGSPNPTTLYINTYAASSSNTTALNNAVGACGSTTFIDATILGYIPPNSKFLIANNCMCKPLDAYDLSNLCGQGPIYVYYGTNSTWPCGSGSGIFGNHSSTNPDVFYFDADFSAVIPGMDIEYNYDKYILTAGNGSYITLNPVGGAATSYGSNACAVPLIVLPIELKYFNGTVKNNTIEINWETYSEENFNHFELEKSKDAFSYYKLADVNSIGNHNGAKYSFVDEAPNVGVNYYKLYSVDNDGRRSYQRTIYVNYLINQNETYSIVYESDKVVVSFKEVTKYTEVNLYNITGQMIKTYSSTDLVSGKLIFENNMFSKGIYIFRVNQKLSSSSDKIIIR